MARNRELTGIMVKVLKPVCIELDKERGGPGFAKSNDVVGIAKSKSGKTYIFEDEGVGPSKALEDGGSLVILLNKVENRDDPMPLSIVPQWTLEINQDLLANNSDFQFEDEERDLALFIRSFGTRLETNFHLWKRTLEE